MSNLVENWVEMATESVKPLSVALTSINSDLGTNYNYSRLGEWRNGRRPVPESVLRYMLEQSLYKILRDHGLTCPDISDDDKYFALVDALMPPKRG